MLLLFSISFADAARVLLAPELAKERRWCYGASSVISTIVVAHAAGPQAALLGQLVFTVHSKQFIEIKQDQQISKQCATKSWVYCIQGELFGDQPGSESFHLDVAIQQSIHHFHNETWSFFTFCNIWNESIGRKARS